MSDFEIGLAVITGTAIAWLIIAVIEYIIYRRNKVMNDFLYERACMMDSAEIYSPLCINKGDIVEIEVDGNHTYNKCKYIYNGDGRFDTLSLDVKIKPGFTLTTEGNINE